MVLLLRGRSGGVGVRLRGRRDLVVLLLSGCGRSVGIMLAGRRWNLFVLLPRGGSSGVGGRFRWRRWQIAVLLLGWRLVVGARRRSSGGISVGRRSVAPYMILGSARRAKRS